MRLVTFTYLTPIPAAKNTAPPVDSHLHMRANRIDALDSAFVRGPMPGMDPTTSVPLVATAVATHCPRRRVSDYYRQRSSRGGRLNRLQTLALGEEEETTG